MTYVYILLSILCLWLLIWLLSSKKRLARRMQAALNAAKFVTFSALFARTDDADEAQLQSLAQLASAKTNYLFGESPSDQHVHLDLPRLHAEAAEWIRANDIFREVVVQSLRVASQLRYMSSGQAEVRGEVILKEFGRQYPEAPSPDSYEGLVRRALTTLSSKTQAELRSRLPVLR
jgi:hypothetical protein